MLGQKRAENSVPVHQSKRGTAGMAPSIQVDEIKTGTKKHADKVIENKLPAYFGVHASRAQNALIKGKHPRALKKDSELWHYAEISNNRQARVGRGHSFRNVLDEENVHQTLPLTGEEGDDDPSSVGKTAEEEEKDNQMETIMKNTTINRKLKEIFQSQVSDDLELKVDFQHSHQVYFGMTCIIMNYNKEVLFVNRHNELRCKALSKVTKQDRIKFKIVDIQNASNPHGLKFGDTFWIQSLESSETADSSYQNGSILASKLYTMPNVDAVDFNMVSTLPPIKAEKNKCARPLDGHGHGGLHMASVDEYDDNDDDNNSMDSWQDHHANSGGHQSGHGVDLGSHASNLDLGDDGISVGSMASRAQTSVSTSVPKPPKKDEVEADEAKKAQRKGKLQPTICGNIDIVRISDVKTLDGSFESGQKLDNIAASRYNSRQSTTMGKWAAHCAIRPGERKLDPKDHIVPDAVYSLQPLFFQQDLYGIGTCAADKFVQWPLQSSAVINGSKNFTAEEALNLKRGSEQRKNVSNTGYSAADKAADLALSGNAEDKKKGWHAALNTVHKQVDIDELVPDIESDHGCLRKLVPRSFPYDYAVDKMCVWKICLFEQFGGGNTEKEMSHKDKQAQKIMQTASMVLKLSKMNREGAKMHIKANYDTTGFASSAADAEKGLPPLLSGESFARTLRQLTTKVTQRLDEKYMLLRREKEVKFQEYFDTRIKFILENENNLHGEPGSPGGGADLDSRPSSSQRKILGKALNGGTIDFKFQSKDGSGQVLSRESGERLMNNAIDEAYAELQSEEHSLQGTLTTKGLMAHKNYHHSYNHNGDFHNDRSRHSSEYESAMDDDSSVISGLSNNTSLFVGHGGGGGGGRRPVSPPSTGDNYDTLLARLKNESSTHMNRNNRSQDVKRVFKDVRPLQLKDMLLNRKYGRQHQNDLSEGEQILAMHKTFLHLRHKSEVQVRTEFTSKDKKLALTGEIAVQDSGSSVNHKIIVSETDNLQAMGASVLGNSAGIASVVGGREEGGPPLSPSPSSPPTRQKLVNSSSQKGIQAKLLKLQQADSSLDQVLAYKARVQKDKDMASQFIDL